MSTHRNISAVVLLAFVFGALPGGACAQSDPAKPVRIIVPFPPGGGTDIVARVVAQRLNASLGKPVIVENKPGAGGAIGTEAAIKAAPDGHTLLMISSSYTVNPGLFKLNFDPVNDITAVVQVSQGGHLIVVNPALPVKSVQELIALAKQHPGKIAFASSGQGGVIHMGTELFCSTAGIKMLHVPYKGTAPALTDTLAGQTSLLIASTPALLPHVKKGRLRAIAVTATERIPALPEVPTVDESGLPGFEVINWQGLIGPKGLPRAVVERLNAEVNKMLALPDMEARLQSEGLVRAGGSPEQFLARIKKEIGVWHKVIADTGVKPE